MAAAEAAPGTGRTGDEPRSISSSSGAVCDGVGPDGRDLSKAPALVTDIRGWMVGMGLNGPPASVAEGREAAPNRFTETLR